jgi:hypothetical protein
MRNLRVLTLLLALLPAAAPAAMFPFNLPWDDASPTFLDRSVLNATPAGASGFVTVGPDGHTWAGGQRIRFWGVNVTSSACFPEHADADKVAARFAKLGVNIVRFHLMDACWGTRCIFDTGAGDTRHLSAANLERMDHFFSRLKAKGIYANLNLLAGRAFRSTDGIPAGIDGMDWKDKQTPAMYVPAMLDLQREYATQLLTHVNPYTGLSYASDPAVAFLEVCNEHGLMHAWRDGKIDTLPADMAAILQQQWSAFLHGRYADQSALAGAWAVTTPPGAEMLGNPAFASGFSSWNLEQHGGAAMTATTPAEGPSGGACARLQVTATGTADWHIQLNQPGLALVSGTVYTASFSAKADRTKVVTFIVEMAHDPWAGLGIAKSVTLTTSWQSFTTTFMATATDANARFNFRNMGDQLATYWFADCSLKPGGSIGLFPGEDLGADSIRLITRSEQGMRNATAQADWTEFLWLKERDYWRGIRDHVKTTLGARGLVMGTVVGNSTPNLMDDLDAVDSHAYWHHPNQPSGWSGPWWIGNSSMVGDRSGGTLGVLACKRVPGKPFSVSEYGHPAPMTFDSEGNLFLAAYGALQDWDALYAYTYNDGTLAWDQDRQDRYFDFQRHPGKCMNLLVGANLFRRADVSPAVQAAAVTLTTVSERAQVPASWAWTLVDARNAGMPVEAGLMHRVYCATDGAAAPAGCLPGSSVAVPASDRFVSDTGQLDWDGAGKVLRVDTPRSKAVLGYSMGQTFDLSGYSIRPVSALQDWACLSLTMMEGTDLADCTRILLSAQGIVTNSDIDYRVYSTGLSAGYPPPADADLTLGSWGASPVTVEGIAASFRVPYASSRVQVFKLDGTGARGSQVVVSSEGGAARFDISGADRTLWYEIVVSPLGTPGTPTSTPTPTREC